MEAKQEGVQICTIRKESEITYPASNKMTTTTTTSEKKKKMDDVRGHFPPLRILWRTKKSLLHFSPFQVDTLTSIQHTEKESCQHSTRHWVTTNLQCITTRKQHGTRLLH